MAKKLGNGDKLRIQEMLASNKSLADIAKELDVKPEVVNEYLQRVFESQAKVDDERKKAHKEATKRVTAKDAMVRKTAGKKVKGVSIMTQAAAEISDDFNESNRRGRTDGGEAFKNRYAGAIGKIDSDE
jgi:IS30 family transposase